MRLLSIAALVIAGLLAVPGGSAHADVGNCSNNANNKVSWVCHYRDTQFSGAYVEWQSTSLNITQATANAGEFISEMLILRDRYYDPPNSTFLEVGDTAGGGNIIGHVGEWARMWYWVNATTVGGYTEHFIQYAPGGGTGDGLNRSWGMQWESADNAWVIYIAGSRKVTVTSWKQPIQTAGMKMLTGLEIYNGLRPLDATKNSGLFANKAHAWRDLNNAWWGWDLRWEQVDSSCGTAPTCLQGWWTNQWNNAKPAQ
jgi:hypothetical protein